MTFEFELTRITRALRTDWPIVVVSAVGMGILIFLVAVVWPARWVASAEITPSSSYAVFQDADSYQQVAVSKPVLDRVIAETDIDISRRELLEKIETRVIPNTNILRIEVRESDPQLALAIVESIVMETEGEVTSVTESTLQSRRDGLVYERDQLASQVADTDRRLDELEPAITSGDSEAEAETTRLRDDRISLLQRIADIDSTIRSLNHQIASVSLVAVVLDSGSMQDKPEGPSRMVFTALGVVLGGGIGGIILLWREYIGRSIRDYEIASQLLDAPAIAIIGSHDDPSELDLVGARLAAIAESWGGRIALVSAIQCSEVETIKERASNEILIANGLSAFPEAIQQAQLADKAIVVIEADTLRSRELSEARDLLKSVGTPPVGFVWIDR